MPLPKADHMDNVVTYLRTTKDLDFYVVNTSDLKGRNKRTEIIFNVKDGDADVSFAIPDTFLPINIGQKVSKLSSFSRSESFMKLLNSGYLKAINLEAAENYLSKDEAITEQQRMDADNFNGDNAFALESGGVQVENALRKAPVNDARPNAGPKVTNIMMNPTMLDDHRLSALKTMQSEITLDDIAFIMQKTTSEKIKTWIQTLRTTLRS